MTYTHEFVITGRRILGRSAYLSCTFQRGPSRGWSARQIILPYILHPPSGAAVIFPLDFFMFYKVYFRYTALSEKLEDSAPFLRVPLSILDVRRFPEEAPKLSANFLSLSVPLNLLRFFFRLIQ